MNNDNWKRTITEKDGVVSYTAEWVGEGDPPQLTEWWRPERDMYTAAQGDIEIDITSLTPEGERVRERLTYDPAGWQEVVRIAGSDENALTGAAFQDPRVIALASSVTRVPLHERTEVEYCECCGRPWEVGDE